MVLLKNGRIKAIFFVFLLLLHFFFSSLEELLKAEAITSIIEDTNDALDEDSSDDELEKEAAVAAARLVRYNSVGSLTGKSSMKRPGSRGHSARFAADLTTAQEGLGGDDDDDYDAAALEEADLPLTEIAPLRTGSLRLRLCLQLATVSKPMRALLSGHLEWEPVTGRGAHIAPTFSISVMNSTTMVTGQLLLNAKHTARILTAICGVATPRAALLRLIRNRDDDKDLLLLALADKLRVVENEGTIQLSLGK